MIVYLPTIRQLQYLVALRDYGHFGKAAESCFVTQSTLSASLRELETLVGVVLTATSLFNLVQSGMFTKLFG